jgi:hypothetical protein
MQSSQEAPRHRLVENQLRRQESSNLRREKINRLQVRRNQLRITLRRLPARMSRQ